jgi:hypothetical protein
MYCNASHITVAVIEELKICDDEQAPKETSEMEGRYWYFQTSEHGFRIIQGIPTTCW